MPKKTKQIKVEETPVEAVEQKPLTPAEVAKAKLPDPVKNMQEVLGFGLASAYNLGVAGGATVAGTKNPVNKLANVDALPEIKKVK
jgi:hypothetical protein